MSIHAPPSLPEAGTLIGGRYEVVALLGTGASGWVVQAIDKTVRDVPVVLKILHPHLIQDEVSKNRFYNEARIARELTHPNIVRIYDIGEAGPHCLFISMEYVAGGTLAKAIKSGEWQSASVAEKVDVLTQIAVGLAHAHDLGVVHRDLKPENILLSGKTIKIADFGLARLNEVGSTITTPGEALGTPIYMSPEALRGSRLDARADIYSFGIMAFELFTGTRPFSSESYFELARQHFDAELPSAVRRNVNTPRWVDRFVRRCCEKNPEDRFQSMHEILADLAPRGNRTEVSGSRSKSTLSVPRGKYRLTARERRRRRREQIISTLMWISIIAATLVMRNHADLYGTVEARIHLLSLESHLGIPNNFLVRFFYVRASGEWASGGLRGDIRPDLKTLASAVRLGALRSAELVLANGISPDNVGVTGQPLLFEAIDRKDMGMVMALLRAGADASIQDPLGRTTLMRAIISGRLPIASTLQRRLPKEFLEHRDLDGRTNLLHAILGLGQAKKQSLGQDEERLALLGAVLQAGAALYVADRQNKSALMYVVETGDEEAFDLVVGKLGAGSLNYRDDAGKTALMYAVQSGTPSMVRKLLRFAPNLSVRDQAGKSAVDYAVALGDQTTIDLLRAAETSQTPSAAGA